MSAGDAVQNLTLAPHAPEHCKRAERLILLIRALQLLSSGMSLASNKLHEGYLKPSSTVKNGNFNQCKIILKFISFQIFSHSYICNEFKIQNHIN